MTNFTFIILVVLLLIPSHVIAQDHVLQVVAESAFVRAAPSEDAEPAASVFANDSLVAVGRNIDGLWLEVRRPGRQTSIGWIARELVALTFDVAELPITDITTGLTGSSPVVDTGFAILTIGEISLRAAPNRDSATLATLPLNLTLPIVARTPDRLWLQINYRGTVGWVPEFLTRTHANLDAVAIAPEYAADPRYSPFDIITPARQIAQIDRLVSWITPINTTAAAVADYWRLMRLGETLECRPPVGNYADYPYTQQDVYELPELRRQMRLLRQAVDDVNASIEAMRRCGVYTDSQIEAAYADAVSATGIFNLILRRMQTLREQIAE